LLWCAPIAIIFPPATLLVKLKSSTPSETLKVPVCDFTRMGYAAPMTWDNPGRSASTVEVLRT
jgi:hypothetical protein